MPGGGGGEGGEMISVEESASFRFASRGTHDTHRARMHVSIDGVYGNPTGCLSHIILTVFLHVSLGLPQRFCYTSLLVQSHAFPGNCCPVRANATTPTSPFPAKLQRLFCQGHSSISFAIVDSTPPPPQKQRHGFPLSCFSTLLSSLWQRRGGATFALHLRRRGG